VRKSPTPFPSNVIHVATMSLVHRSKLTHYFAPSAQYLGAFFNSLTELYAAQQHTDLVLVAGNTKPSHQNEEEEEQDMAQASPKAAVFGTHQVRRNVIVN
jgi:hypothetical protein